LGLLIRVICVIRGWVGFIRDIGVIRGRGWGLFVEIVLNPRNWRFISFNCGYLRPNDPLRRANGDHLRISCIDRRQQVEGWILPNQMLKIFKFGPAIKSGTTTWDDQTPLVPNQNTLGMNLKTINRVMQTRPVNHLIYWTLFVLVGSYVFSYRQNFPYIFYLLNLLVHLPVLLLYTYFVIYLLIPHFLLRKRYLPFFGLLAASSAIASLLKMYVSKNIYFTLFIPKALYPEQWYTVDAFLVNLLWIIGPAMLFAMTKYYKEWIRSQDISNEAERKRLATELQVLKGQLNPHFLFNTLNNLYSLALSKSDKTAVVVAKMSDMFRYILYECNATEVPVSKELKLIEDYIELEQIRYSDRLSIQFDKEIDNRNYLVPPMLLYSIVENCFKHGSSPDPDQPWIKISLRVQNNSLVFETSNSIPTRTKKFNTEGVGLLNSTRRLELIYPEQHRLTTRDDNDKFHVWLEITKPEIRFS
jgi:hypothetical protein